MSAITKSKAFKIATATLIVAAFALLPFVGTGLAYTHATTLALTDEQKLGAEQPKGTIEAADDTDLGKIILGIANIVTGVVGAIAVLMLIYGGLRYIVSQGNEDDIEKAKNIILYAIVGIVVILIAYVVVIGVINLTNTAATPA